MHPTSHKIQHIPLHPLIQQQHKSTQLYVDFFYVNQMAFLLTINNKIRCRTATYTTSNSTNNFSNILTSVINKYAKRGFEIHTCHGDNEFNIESLKENLEPTKLEIYASEEHVGLAENCIKNIKERARCICHSAPYIYYPKIS